LPTGWWGPAGRCNLRSGMDEVQDLAAGLRRHHKPLTAKARAMGCQVIATRARERATDLAPLLAELKAQGTVTLHALAAAPEERGIADGTPLRSIGYCRGVEEIRSAKPVCLSKSTGPCTGAPTRPLRPSLSHMYGPAVHRKRFRRSVGLRSCVNVSGLVWGFRCQAFRLFIFLLSYLFHSFVRPAPRAFFCPDRKSLGRRAQGLSRLAALRGHP
jgi:hypothetical protein